MKIICQNCNKTYNIDNNKVPLKTKVIKCKECQSPITVQGKNNSNNFFKKDYSSPNLITDRNSNIEKIEKERTKQCSFCGERILFFAKKCKYCSSNLDKSNNNITQSTVDYEVYLLAIPVIATILIWFWASELNLLQLLVNIMELLMLFTVLGTALIAAKEVNNSGIKPDRKKGIYSATTWFFLITFLWVVCYPIYLYKRKYYGLDNKFFVGIIISIIFLVSWGVMNSTIENKKTEIINQLNFFK
ncbi:zinc-ribbon domain-containing protein [Candidatus Venteria ishoeyi]|uniref:Zinc finger/thioredoxin putative domain-containing protein n=1 Tax=Candidatus Venteria ishoeyi TaxID=1899563 RepID=A0A1H6F3M5_9GAMM|nr:zinc-ribbon domain-containing protein [Candidatus Venteria ishoeyi]SEH04720.1 Uncharacterised protein [Candidatus Venteria ishoeyi]